jgi:holo-[acyl-carrier protein] synthase
MIYGIGTDIAAVARFSRMQARYGARVAERLLTTLEQGDFAHAAQPGRFLARRFAAKEAFGKALGTGIRVPATLRSIGVAHDALGKPVLSFAPALADLIDRLGLRAHLSISDEADFAVAFVVLEQIPGRENRS